MSRPPDRSREPLPPAEEAQLTTEEIEAILSQEPQDPDAASAEPRETHHLAVREPGRGWVGKLLVWLLVAFICMNIYHAWRG